MKANVLLAAAAAAAALTGASSAEARGYECSFRTTVPGVTVALDGNANSRSGCESFRSAFQGRRVATHPGRAYCGWRHRSLDLRVYVYARTATTGRLFCQLMATQVKGPLFRRIL